MYFLQKDDTFNATFGIFRRHWLDPKNPFDHNDWTLNSAGKLLKSKKVMAKLHL